MNIYQATPGSTDENALTLLTLHARDPMPSGHRLDHHAADIRQTPATSADEALLQRDLER